QSWVRPEHRFAARDARRAVHRLRLDRADALQTQRHRQKNPRSSRNRDAEFRGHSARTTDRRTAAIEVSNSGEAGERRSVVWNFASVVRSERGTISRADCVCSREAQERRDRRGIHRRARALREHPWQHALAAVPDSRINFSRSAAERTKDRDLQSEVGREISETLGIGGPIRRKPRSRTGERDRADVQRYLSIVDDRRLRAHRSPTFAREQALFYRGEPEPASRGGRRFCAIGDERGPHVSAVDSSNHPARDDSEPEWPLTEAPTRTG